MVAGLFFVFEGPEGAGKSTQIRLLADHLRTAGRYVVETREPGGTPLGERIRSLLLDHDSVKVCAEAEALLLNAARAQHVRDVILPAMQEGAIVLCDRFVDSTLAYQGGGRGLAMDQLRALQSFAVGDLAPRLRILLDVPIELGLHRRRAETGTTNRIDEESLAFHQRVRESFLRLASDNPDQWIVVDAAGSVNDVAASIYDNLCERMDWRQDFNSPAVHHDNTARRV